MRVGSNFKVNGKAHAEKFDWTGVKHQLCCLREDNDALSALQFGAFADKIALSNVSNL